MSENTEQASGPHRTISQAMLSEMFTKSFDKLSHDDQNVFKYGAMWLGGYAGLSGLLANSLFRRVLNIQKALLISSMPMAMLPCLTASAFFDTVVSTPLLTGNLDCSTCAVSRGALIGLLGGGLYPVVLALPGNIALAYQFCSTPLPEMNSVGSVLRFSWDVSRPVLKRMKTVFVFEALLGAYLGHRHFEAYTNLVQITFSEEEASHESSELKSNTF